MHFDLIAWLSHVKPQYMILMQGCIVLLIPYLLWRTAGLSRWVPLGVIQILAGVLLGPAIFGALFPDLFASRAPATTLVQVNEPQSPQQGTPATPSNTPSGSASSYARNSLLMSLRFAL